MKRLIILEIFLILSLCAGQFPYRIGFAAHRAQCPSTRVLVYTDTQSDIPIVCKAAADTISFMVDAGLEVQDAFDIHLTDGRQSFPQQDAYLGVYSHQIKEIHVLSYEWCRRRCKDECFCGIELSRELHTSLIVHEIAHALTVDHLENDIGRAAAAEYIAYTTQFSLMPDHLRQKILAGIPNKGFYHEIEITSLFHDLNPSVFAVKAYRHFIRPENGKRFYRRIITGQCVLDRDD